MNSKQIIPALAVAVWAILNTACSVDTISSKEVSAQSIHQSLSVNFDEATNSTSYYAQFRVGGITGTTVDLQAPAQITANGQVLSRHTFLGTSYSGGANGLVANAQFDWTSQDGKVYSNSATLRPLTMIPPQATLSRGQQFKLALSGPSLNRDEYIRARIEQNSTPSTGERKYIYIDGNLDASTLTVTFVPSEMLKLQQGSAQLIVTRTNSHSLSQGTREGGGISANYQLRPVDLMIIDSNNTQLSMAQK